MERERKKTATENEIDKKRNERKTNIDRVRQKKQRTEIISRFTHKVENQKTKPRKNQKKKMKL